MQQFNQSQKVGFHVDDIVFAPKANKQVWPAKIVKILSQNVFQVKFYMLRHQVKASKDQIQPFNPQTCQKYITQKSTTFFKKVVQMAKKNSQKKMREQKNAEQCHQNDEDSLNRSFSLQNVNFEVNSSNIQIPFSQKRGLFVIEEVLPNFQESQSENSCPQHPAHQPHLKKYTSKGKHQVELVPLEKESQDSCRTYSTRLQIRKKNKRAKKALLRERQKQIESEMGTAKVQSDQKFQGSPKKVNESQKVVIQDTTEKNIQAEYSQAEALTQNQQNQQIIRQSLPQTQIQTEHPNNFNQEQNLPQQNGQNLVFFGPVDIVDLSTEASVHSIHTNPAQQTASTMASVNDVSQHSPHYRLEEQKNQQQLSVNTETTKTQPTQDDQQQESRVFSDNSVQPSSQTISSIIMQLLLKLSRYVEGQGDILSLEEQVKLSRSLDNLKQTALDKTVTSQMVEFVDLFQNSKSRNKEKCYMQYFMIRSRLQILVLVNKSQPKSSMQSQVLQILQNYQSRKQTIK